MLRLRLNNKLDYNSIQNIFTLRLEETKTQAQQSKLRFTSISLYTLLARVVLRKPRIPTIETMESSCTSFFNYAFKASVHLQAHKIIFLGDIIQMCKNTHCPLYGDHVVDCSLNENDLVAKMAHNLNALDFRLEELIAY